MQNTLQEETAIQSEIKQNENPQPRSFFLKVLDWLPIRKKRLETFDDVKLRMARRKLVNPQSSISLHQEEEELRKEIDRVESSEKIGGVDFSKCDFELIWKNYLEGDILEVDTFSPYLSDHDQRDGSFIGLTKSEAIGLTMGKYLKTIFPKSKTVTLYDDYNNTLRDSNDIYGRPNRSGPMLAFSEQAKANFLINVRQRLREYKLIGESDKEGQDYYIISETSKIQEAEKFVGLLEAKGLVKRKGQEIMFVNSDSEHPFYQKILLRDSQGKWTCEALDASSFLNPVNTNRTHLVILPQSFLEQQDKVWEMLRLINISPENYHNIFYDENLSPEEVKSRIEWKLEEGKRKLIGEGSQFDVGEYIWRNYGEKILDEDRVIIDEVTKTVLELGIEKGSLVKAVDVGVGPNLYPSMILSPFIAENGGIDLIEYSPTNIEYLNSVLDNDSGDKFGKLKGIWSKFESLLSSRSPIWSNCFLRVRKIAKIIQGSIYNLPRNEYNAVSSFFCAESITDNPEKFQEAIDSLIDSVKPGGLIITAHMLGSKGYPAGENTNFPALSITTEDLEKVYEEKANVRVMKVNAPQAVREGYHGMAIVIGRKK